MVNYNLGKIYKIVDNTNNNIYVGSTCEPILARRLAGHVTSYKRFLKNNKNNISSYQILANGDYDIVLLELCSCDNKDELHKRERHYIETLECINKNVAGRSAREYMRDHREQNKEHQKEHYELNKDKLCLYQREYYKNKKIEQAINKELII